MKITLERVGKLTLLDVVIGRDFAPRVDILRRTDTGEYFQVTYDRKFYRKTAPPQSEFDVLTYGKWGDYQMFLNQLTKNSAIIGLDELNPRTKGELE